MVLSGGGGGGPGGPHANFDIIQSKGRILVHFQPKSITYSSMTDFDEVLVVTCVFIEI